MAYPQASTGGRAGSDDSADQSVSAHPRFPELELAVLDYWKSDGTFAASVAHRDAGENGANEFVFYDGPPFANGLPHYGHLLTGYVKDLVPRYQTMRGRRVERRFGWDTHGLPAELEAMRQLGIKTKEEILELGIGTFNEACRRSVLQYTDDWREYVTRQARWVDFDNDYKTLNPDYMESVIWAFKQLYDKGLAYQGFRVLPYCWNDQTPLSNHELGMDDDVYQMRQDPAVTVGLRLETTEPSDPLSGALALVWTTTPWTLPSNLAIMVGPDIDYLVVEAAHPAYTGTNERYVIAEARLPAYAREFGENAGERIVKRLKGSELLGRSYTPPFGYFVGHHGAHRVLEADFVTTTDGTGLVHNAGAFGEEDKTVTDANGIEPVIPVGADGCFRFPVTEYEGMLVFDANAHIIDHLLARTRGAGEMGDSTAGTVLLRRETYDHSYPHCWRCRNPLIYMAVSSWFISVTKFRDRMVELNKQICWVPEHVGPGQFGKWLANARDWSVSRNRFWGSPIPVWTSDDPAYPRVDVYGSFAELERDFGTLPTRTDEQTGQQAVDLHRPYVDRLVRPNPDDPTGNSMMRRVEDVLDVWFDSGSMSYAQVHHPFENADWFTEHFPADFIVEYMPQTRGWFYTLHVLATALFDRPAFANCISHGTVLGDDGQKMSKSLNNYPDVFEVFERDGADAMRWFLMSSPILRGGNLIVTEAGIREGVRQAELPLWNAWYFLSLYANAAGHQGVWRTDSADVLDRYLLAKTADLVLVVTPQLDSYDIAGACASVRSFLEVLTNWYVRRSRQRFWDGDADAVDTLHTVLEVLCRVSAPLLPLTTEAIWRGLTGERSVHLTDWPAADGEGALPRDDTLVSAMDEVRAVASVALSLRKANKLRVRQPLATMTVSVADPVALQQFSSLLADQVNVRTAQLTELADSDERVTRSLTLNTRAAGPRLGRDVQQVIKAAKAGDWSVGDDGSVVCGGVPLTGDEYVLELVAAGAAAGSSTAVGMLPSGGFVTLDIGLTDELRADGAVADLLRLVQQARKDAGLQVSDRISLSLDVSDALWQHVSDRVEQVKAETLAVSVQRSSLADGPGVLSGSVGDNESVRVRVTPVA
ncbi:MAG: isoleucine--tRNA ligase [Actinomycetota bacterium]|nr:isoleucine--tRNA ligase [Actinomycetota bacterium]